MLTNFVLSISDPALTDFTAVCPADSALTDFLLGLRMDQINSIPDIIRATTTVDTSFSRFTGDESLWCCFNDTSLIFRDQHFIRCNPIAPRELIEEVLNNGKPFLNGGLQRYAITGDTSVLPDSGAIFSSWHRETSNCGNFTRVVHLTLDKQIIETTM
jgi:hypothetical protein